MTPDLRDEPTELQQRYVGKVARLDIPLHSVITLRRIAEELHGLATNLDWLSRRHEAPAVVLLEARWHVEKAEKKMRGIRGKGRPPKTPTKFRAPNDC